MAHFFWSLKSALRAFRGSNRACTWAGCWRTSTRSTRQRVRGRPHIARTGLMLGSKECCDSHGERSRLQSPLKLTCMATATYKFGCPIWCVPVSSGPGDSARSFSMWFIVFLVIAHSKVHFSEFWHLNPALRGFSDISAALRSRLRRGRRSTKIRRCATVLRYGESPWERVYNLARLHVSASILNA